MRTLLTNIKDYFKVVSFSLKASFASSRKYFILRLLLNLVGIVIPFVLIFFSRLIINLLAEGYFVADEVQSIITSLIVFNVVVLGLGITNRIINILSTHFEGLHRDCLDVYSQTKIMEKSAGIDLSFFDSTTFYDELQDTLRNRFLLIDSTSRVFNLFRYFFQLILSFFYLSSYHILYAAMILAVAIPHIIFERKFYMNLYQWQRDAIGSERKLSYLSSLLTQKNYAKDVKFYHLGAYIRKKYQTLWNIWFSEKRKIMSKSTLILTLTSMLPEIATAFLLVQLGISVIYKNITMGDYTYYQGIIGQLLAAIYIFITSFSELADSKARIKNYWKFFDWKNKVDETGKRKRSGKHFIIEFKDVSFSYESHLPRILDHMSFEIHSQEKTALVGINGSGKSTIIKLILRFYDPTEGVILLNGIDIKEYDVGEIRKCFSTLFQDYCNYAFSVAESVSLSDLGKQADEEAVEDALKRSGAHSFVKTFKNKAHTFLTREYDEDGEELSGGQWQKIALARTFYRNAPMYILDEPSASLDAESEDELFTNYEKLYHNKGAILVSHRLSNIMSCDQILVIHDGKIAEKGTHKELMQRRGKYAHMFALQANKYAEKQD